MIPMPQDIPGTITIIWFFLWMSALNWTMDNIAEHCEARLLSFLLYGFIITLLMVGFRNLIAWVWC